MDVRILSETRIVVLFAAIFAVSLQAADQARADETSKLADATEHLQRGRYEEAAEAFTDFVKSENEAVRSAATIGLSRALESQGQYKEAITRLTEIAKPSPAIFVEAARLQYLIGRFEESAVSCEAALKADADQPLAHLVLARLSTESGDLKRASDEFRWFVRYYNRKQPTDAETLLLVAEGAAEYARWNSNSSIFNFIINTLCVDALKDDPLSWQTHLASGSLLLEKYNRAQALPDLKKALEINPRAAAVIVALGEAALQKHDVAVALTYAEQALRIQDNYVPTLRLMADIALNKQSPDAALLALEEARKINPFDSETLGRLAATFYLLDVQPGEEADQRLLELLANLDVIDEVDLKEPSRLEKLLIDVATRNSKPGVFLNAFASTLESRRKYAMAEKLYEHAIRVMPQLSQPKTSLGMLYMQTGRSDQAKQLLDEAFQADPYHVRVSNMRKVLGVLSGYETITTDHFVIRVDSQADKILGEYMAEYLEEVYPELVELYGYEPPQRSVFEIYNNAKGLSAHQWFSARMVGLPWIQTIGASTGMMVALASPTASPQPYNWARVVKHEFVHVLTLQQTHFNIPHWFTEALAVTSEDIQRPAEWNRMLLERVPSGELWSLDELTGIFVRPETPADWQFAYCQSRLYAQYMIETFGKESISRMLDLYRNNVRTNDAIPLVFGMSAEKFDEGYRDFLKRIVENELGGSVSQSPKSIADLEKEFNAEPDSPATMAAFAHALFKANRRRQARELAEQAFEKNPREPMAAVVLAELELLASDVDEAVAFLEAAFDAESPNADVLGLLAKLRLVQSQPEEAARLYELGRTKFKIDQSYLPQSGEWLKGLAAAYIQLKKDDKLKDVLESIASLDGDNPVVRRKLAQLADDKGNVVEAGRWAKEALHIDVTDPETHRILAKLHDHEGRPEKAAKEREIAENLENESLE
ncbi:MAG: tetratricopeptide repeat protein [Planctomycetaceae bacterium]|nr:tetratricopeptide repeat protein [Planctomycetaceae bacterium]